MLDMNIHAEELSSYYDEIEVIIVNTFIWFIY